MTDLEEGELAPETLPLKKLKTETRDTPSQSGGSTEKSGREKKKKKSRRNHGREDRHREDRHRDDNREDRHRDDRHRDDKHREDRHREDRHREDKHREDRHREDRHREDKHREDRHREDKHREDRHREDNHRDDRRREDRHREDKHREDRHREDRHRDERHREDNYREDRHREENREDRHREDRHREENREDRHREDRHRDERHRATDKHVQFAESPPAHRSSTTLTQKAALPELSLDHPEIAEPVIPADPELESQLLQMMDIDPEEEIRKQRERLRQIEQKLKKSDAPQIEQNLKKSDAPQIDQKLKKSDAPQIDQKLKKSGVSQVDQKLKKGDVSPKTQGVATSEKSPQVKSPAASVEMLTESLEREGTQLIVKAAPSSESPPHSPAEVSEDLIEQEEREREKKRLDLLQNSDNKTQNSNTNSTNTNNNNGKNSKTNSKNQEDEEFDMFSDSPIVVEKPANQQVLAAQADTTDDQEGYYVYRVGEVLNNRYSLLNLLGKGVFSTVIKARDLDMPEERFVAIKVIRNNEAMKRMSMKEVQILKELNEKDPQNKYNVVRLIDHFTDREHLCLVFEVMGGGNLRDVLKKYGAKVGLSINAVQIYAKRLLWALKLLKKGQILHADLKLDNILVNQAKTAIKLADFGSASTIHENGITPYLQSRFYRAPEIMIGMQYSYPIDMWSVACCLYEIFTGKMLFPGKDNNDMLHKIQEVSGPVPKKLLKKGQFADRHFNLDTGAFRREMSDSYNTTSYVKEELLTRPTRDLKKELTASPCTPEDKKLVLEFVDLLAQMLVIDPQQRISVENALLHPFIASLKN